MMLAGLLSFSLRRDSMPVHRKSMLRLNGCRWRKNVTFSPPLISFLSLAIFSVMATAYDAVATHV